MWFYYLIYFILVAAFLIGVKRNIQKQVFVILLILLFFIIGLRPATCCADYLNYVDYYWNLSSHSLIQLEPTYFVIAGFSKVFFNKPLTVFLIYGLLGIYLKGLAFVKLSKFYFLSLIVYASYYFLLHEMTQIRVAIASSILLLSIPTIYEKHVAKFLFLILLGTLFHYSFLIFIFFYLLDPKQLNPYFYIGIIFFSYFIYMMGINTVSLLEHIPIEFISDKVKMYNSMLELGVDTKINVFNILVIFRIAFLLFLLLKWELLYAQNKFAVILIKIYSFSIASFIFLHSLPVLAFRTRELLGIVEIILLPFLIYLIKEKHIAFIIIFLIGLALMSIEIWYNNLIHSYF